MPQERPGNAPGSWGGLGVCLGPVLHRFGISLELVQGSVLGWIWDQFGMDPGLSWGQFGDDLGSVWGRFGIGQRSTLPGFWNDLVRKGIVRTGGPIGMWRGLAKV